MTIQLNFPQLTDLLHVLQVIWQTSDQTSQLKK